MRLLNLISFLLIFGCCSTHHEKIREELRTKYNKNFEFFESYDQESFFFVNHFSGTPFSDNFHSYSQLIGYQVKSGRYRKTLDTTFYSSNNYSDIKLDPNNYSINSDSLKFQFVQCPDGDDSCKTISLILPSLNLCSNCR